MTLTIELDEPDLAKLTDEANGLGISVEELVRRILVRHVNSRLVVSDEALHVSLDASFKKNAESYSRLAKM